MDCRDSKQMCSVYVLFIDLPPFGIDNAVQSREGVSLILNLLRQSRLQPMTLGGPEPIGPGPEAVIEAHNNTPPPNGLMSRLKSWFKPPSDT
jgi:hypothetical protein